MIDVKGTKYVNSITLLPFTSAILMIDPNPAPPVIPVYTGSVIENATPAALEMTYNVNLANILPAPSAFTVQVNGVNINESSVAISGNKVRLTLASPVIFGDRVTVSYYKLGSNLLQTSSGGEAASLNSQPVTNNCFGTITLVSADIKARKIIIYPNPAQDFFNISIKDPNLEPDIIRIIDLYGTIVFTVPIECVKNVQIPINLTTGNYIVTLESGSLVLYTQKLIINK